MTITFPVVYKATLELPGSTAGMEVDGLRPTIAEGLRATRRCKWVRTEEDSVHFRSGLFAFKFGAHPLAAITSGTIRADRGAGVTVLSYQLSFTELVLYTAGMLVFWMFTEILMGRLQVESVQTALWVFVLFLIGNCGCAVWWFRRFLRQVTAPGPS